MRHLFAAAFLVMALAACSEASPWRPPGPLPPGCSLTLRAEVPLRNLRNFMLAPARLNGRAVTMIVDTGAEVTTITPDAIALLGLDSAPDTGKPHLVHGVTGDVQARNVRLQDIALGGQVLRRNSGADVGQLPGFPGVDPPVAGLLGADVLSGYELELDLPARRMALYSAVGCAGYTPWPGALAVPVQRNRNGLVFADALVNGRRVRALLDSGARTSLVRRSTAITLGVSASQLAADSEQTGVGVGLGSVTFYQHRFEQIGLPGDTEQNVLADVAEMHLSGIEMLLGADYFGQRHVWISYGTGRVFLRK